jgi:hypothetical protein
MRTVLSGIHLFNDNLKILGQHFILNRNRGEESRETEKERVCKSQNMVEKERYCRS